MWGFQRGSRLLATLLRTPRAPRAPIASKPPEHPLSAAGMIPTSTGAAPAAGTLLGWEQAIAFTVMCTCFLGPTAWVLAHVEHYKSKGE